MYLALIVLPILGSIFSGFFGRKIGVSGSQLITCTCIITTTFIAVFSLIEVGINNVPVTVNLFRWVDAESLNVFWSFSFDSLTVSMLIPVLIVSSLVHVYSIGYMSHDPHNQRFFSYLSLFTFMMIILVTADNFLLMFVGWEGVGVCSYLLVSFWFTRIAANQSSLSAFLTNRVGDCFLTIGMFSMLWSFGNIDYSTVFSLSGYYNESIIILTGICLLIGAMAKSSQVGLHVWLPMAMEGPTPVSALIHAATMVTAGVYLLMRASPLIEYSSTVLLICLWVGAITTVFSSLVGLFQQDIKKVIAYSTMSQLGMMVIAVGLSSYNIALFHLVNHAFYKGLLFLGAGAVIHAVADNQDFRKYGGLISYLPLSYSVMLIASLSLVAFPFMTGFYSKDFILESAYGKYEFSSISVYFIATIGAMFTTLYSVKVLYLTFITNPNGPMVNYKTSSAAHEGDIFMSTPLIILAIFSIFFGFLTKDIFIGLGSSFFSDNALFIHPYHEIVLNTEFAVPTFFKLLPLFFTITLTFISIIITEFIPRWVINFKLSEFGYNIFGFFNQRFGVEHLYNKFISGPVLKLGGQAIKIMDKGIVETFGPNGLQRTFTNISAYINNLSSGIVTVYALYILIGLLSFISVLYLTNNEDNYFQLIIILFLLIAFVMGETMHSTIIPSKNLQHSTILESRILYTPSYKRIKKLKIPKLKKRKRFFSSTNNRKMDPATATAATAVAVGPPMKAILATLGASMFLLIKLGFILDFFGTTQSIDVAVSIFSQFGDIHQALAAYLGKCAEINVLLRDCLNEYASQGCIDSVMTIIYDLCGNMNQFFDGNIDLTKFTLQELSILKSMVTDYLGYHAVMYDLFVNVHEHISNIIDTLQSRNELGEEVLSHYQMHITTQAFNFHNYLDTADRNVDHLLREETYLLHLRDRFEDFLNAINAELSSRTQ